MYICSNEEIKYGHCNLFSDFTILFHRYTIYPHGTYKKIPIQDKNSDICFYYSGVDPDRSYPTLRFSGTEVIALPRLSIEISGTNANYFL